MLIALIWFAFIWICFAYSMYAGANKFSMDSPMLLVPFLAVAYILAIFSYLHIRRLREQQPNDTYALTNLQYVTVHNGQNHESS